MKITLFKKKLVELTSFPLEILLLSNFIFYLSFPLLKMSSKSYKRRQRRKAEKEVSKRLKVDEIMNKVNARYATSDADSEFSDNNFPYVNIDECEMRNVEQDPDLPNNDASSSEDEINNDSLSSANDESDDNRPDIDFVNNNDERNVIEFENNAEKEEYIIESIREWALDVGHLSMRKLNDLLNRLSVVFSRIPRNYKTLLGTPDYINVVEFDGGCKF